MSEPSSTRPYLVRAIREWALDNGLTPQILVAADIDGVEVPRSHVSDGQIVLNIHDRAVDGLVMDKQWVRFSARFGGTPFGISIPMEAILGIFARETSQGIFFQAKEPADAPSPPSTSPTDDGGERKKPHLKLVE